MTRIQLMLVALVATFTAFVNAGQAATSGEGPDPVSVTECSPVAGISNVVRHPCLKSLRIFSIAHAPGSCSFLNSQPCVFEWRVIASIKDECVDQHGFDNSQIRENSIVTLSCGSFTNIQFSFLGAPIGGVFFIFEQCRLIPFSELEEVETPPIDVDPDVESAG